MRRNNAVWPEARLRCVNKIESLARIYYISLLHPSLLLFPFLSKSQQHPRGRSVGKVPLSFRRSRKVWRRCDGGPTSWMHPVQEASFSIRFSSEASCTVAPSFHLVFLVTLSRETRSCIFHSNFYAHDFLREL